MRNADSLKSKLLVGKGEVQQNLRKSFLRARMEFWVGSLSEFSSKIFERSQVHSGGEQENFGI